MKVGMAWQFARHRWIALTLTVLIAMSSVVASALAVSGNIDPNAIEIDKNANLYPGDGNANILNPGATLDWVKDSLANTDPASLNNSIAEGIIVGQTGAAKLGHWNGVRIVDGLNQGDQDIFLKGGKENDTSTWNVGPGSVGSSKYDASQAYLANNQSDLFFGMERSGNNGTTAFDFEFNQKAPLVAGSYIPNRSVNDVLFTFEMQGSGGSGSAVPHVFVWDGSSYVEQSPLPAGVVSSINQSPVPAAPWGYVDSHGNWTTGNIPNFEFAEAKAPLSLLSGVNSCGGKAFVQIRTRSSSTASSDLKDTTKIFEFVFAGLTASASKTSADGSALSVTLTGSATGATAPIDYQWQVKSGNSWVNISNATAATLVYSNFEADDASPDSTSFSLGGDSYAGKIFSVDLRLHASKTTNGNTCSADSAPVTVKKVTAVDP